MEIFKDFDLTKINTFGVRAMAKLYVEIDSETQIPELFSMVEFKENKKLFLGGGSNILFTEDYDGMVVANKIKGVKVLDEDKDNIIIHVCAGEVWRDLVNLTVENNWWGIENLAYIPGTVGGAPVQNIGAYGVELKDTLDTVEAYEVATGVKKVFQNTECKFGYRDSVFKKELKGQYFITAITLKLSKIARPNTSYKILAEYLSEHNINVMSPEDISKAVTSIRKSKLPDPSVIGNAGSFFKNIYVTKEKLNYLKEVYPDIPSFSEEEGIKIPSGWLVEHAGWKGKRVGNVGVHDKQALVLVNFGGGRGHDIKNLAQSIKLDVYNKFGVELVPEVNII